MFKQIQQGVKLLSKVFTNQDNYYEMNMPPYGYDYYYPQQPMYPNYPAQPMYPSQPTYPPTQPTYPTQPTTPTIPMPSQPTEPGIDVPGILPYEQSYIENILRLNLGKIATIYMTFENNTQWNAKVFKGRLEAAGRDHIIISDPQTGMRYLLQMLNLDYITFDEELNYEPPRIP